MEARGIYKGGSIIRFRLTYEGEVIYSLRAVYICTLGHDDNSFFAGG